MIAIIRRNSKDIETNNTIKLHILGVWQNSDEYIRRLHYEEITMSQATCEVQLALLRVGEKPKIECSNL